MFSVIKGAYLGVSLLGHMVPYAQPYEELPGCFLVAVPFYIPTSEI